MPTRSRTVLLAPSHPTTKRASTAADARPPADLHGGLLGGGRLDQPLERRLPEHAGVRPAARPDRSAAEAQERLARAVAPLVLAARLGDRPKLGTDAEALEDAPDLVVEVDRPRQVVRRGVALDHDDPTTPLPQERGEHRADGAAAHDRNVEVGRPHAGPLAHHRAPYLIK